MQRAILRSLLLSSCFIGLMACSDGSKHVKSGDDADRGDDSGESSERADSEGGGKGSDAEGKQASKGKDSWDDVEQSDVSDEQKGARKKASRSGSTSDNVKDNPEPEFKEGGSVNDAIAAVPQGLPRENIEQEELDKPLLDPELYASCKLGAGAHFELKFAVWNGRCVGMDIKSMPKNPKLETCLREVVSNVKWRAKSKSLNISTVSF